MNDILKRLLARPVPLTNLSHFPRRQFRYQQNHNHTRQRERTPVYIAVLCAPPQKV